MTPEQKQAVYRLASAGHSFESLVVPLASGYRCDGKPLPEGQALRRLVLEIDQLVAACRECRDVLAK